MFQLECKNLAKFYGKTEVFRKLCFLSEGNLCTGIQGINGSGKSTLLKCITGLLRPSEGKLIWQNDGQPVSMQSIRHYIGFAAPYIQFYSELSVIENLEFLKKIRFFQRNQKDAEKINLKNQFGQFADIPDYLKQFGLSELSKREFGKLSSGQQQRVRLAGALISDPPILILDEPGTNLDKDGMALVTAIIKQRRITEGMTFLASNREEELRLCDKIVMLSPARK